MDTPFPLGRIRRHDPRSLNYRAELADKPASVNWKLYGRVVNQENLGACTTHALANILNTRPFHKPFSPYFRETKAVPWYSRATHIDPFPGAWPPQDTGSSGIAACKAAIETGDISGYTWAFGFDELLRRLPLSAVMVGSIWRRRMFYPSRENIVTVDGPEEGGHEYVISAYDARRGLCRIINSWPGWGLRGTAWIPAEQLEPLVNDGGDVTVPVR